MKFFVCLMALCGACYADSEMELIRELSDAHGGGSFEGPVREVLERELQPLGMEIKVDALGNLLGFREQKGNKPRVLLMAHMDEVSFMVREITEEGFLVFDSIGNWVDPVVAGQKWVVMTPNGPVKGITGVESSHTIVGYPNDLEVNQKKLFLDVGVHSKHEAQELGIRPGLPMTPDVSFEQLNNLYCGKAFDDRLGLAAIVMALKEVYGEELPCEVVFAGTVQEEFWMVGSQAVFENTHPDVVVNIEVGVARDFPLIYPTHLSHNPKLGLGPTIFVYDSSMLPSNSLVEYFTGLAVEKSIPFQYEAEVLNFSQDGCRLQGAGCGTHVINLGIPTRYIHAPYGMTDRNDFDQMVQLLAEFVRGFGRQELERLWQ